jgi:hypothetical protein
MSSPIRRWCLLALLIVILFPASIHAADARDSASPYGVLAFLDWDHDWNGYFSGGDRLEQSAAKIQESGAVWVRTAFEWSDMEPEKGHFVFTKYDKLLDALDRHHLKTLAILCYNPSWRSGEWNQAPVPEDFVAYSRAVVNHFKGRVKYWEIWNEPDQSDYWIPQDDLVAYGQLLKAVYPVIKKEDPTAQVVMGAIVDEIPFRLRRLYRRIGKESFDVVNIHPFVHPHAESAVAHLHGVYVATTKVMAEFGDSDKPIWITEIGCPGVVKPDTSNIWWLGEATTEAEQAQWVTTVYTNALQWKGVQKIFWAFFRETNDYFHNGVDHFGLVRADFSEKPAFKAYQQLKKTP